MSAFLFACQIVGTLSLVLLVHSFVRLYRTFEALRVAGEIEQ